MIPATALRSRFRSSPRTGDGSRGRDRRSGRTRPLAAIIVLALLSGCTGLAVFGGDRPTDADVHAPPAADVSAPRTAGDPTVGHASRPASAPPSPPPVPRASRLLGRTAAQLVSLVGRPDLVRREETVQIFQYRSADGCVLELALYERGGRFLTRYVTARRRADGEEMHPDRCLARLLPPERRAALAEPPSRGAPVAGTTAATPAERKDTPADAPPPR